MYTEEQLRYAKKIKKNGKCDEWEKSCPISDNCRWTNSCMQAANEVIHQSKVDSGEIVMVSEKNIGEYKAIFELHGKEKAIEFAIEKNKKSKQTEQ